MKKYIIFTISLICFYFIVNLLMSALVNTAFQSGWLGAWSKGQQLTESLTFGLLYNPIDLISLIISFVISLFVTSKVKVS